MIVVGQKKTYRNSLNRSIIMLSRNRLNGKRRGKKIAVNLVLIVSSTVALNLSLNLQISFAPMKSPREEEQLRLCYFLFMLVLLCLFQYV